MVNSRESVTVDVPTNEVLDFITDQVNKEDAMRIKALIDQEAQNNART